MTELILSILLGIALYRLRAAQRRDATLRRRIAAYEEAIRLNLERQNALTARIAQLEQVLERRAGAALIRPGILVEHEYNAGYIVHLYSPN